MNEIAKLNMIKEYWKKANYGHDFQMKALKGERNG